MSDTATHDGVTRLPLQHCPICQEALTAAGTIDHSDDAPRPGDWTICAYCLHWLRYTRPFPEGPLGLRAVTADEWAALSPEERAHFDRVRIGVRLAFAGARSAKP